MMSSILAWPFYNLYFHADLQYYVWQQPTTIVLSCATPTVQWDDVAIPKDTQEITESC